LYEYRAGTLNRYTIFKFRRVFTLLAGRPIPSRVSRGHCSNTAHCETIEYRFVELLAWPALRLNRSPKATTRGWLWSNNWELFREQN